MRARTRSLLVLHDASQLARVRAHSPEALDGDVIAFDTDIHLLLAEQGVEHWCPWSIIGRDERPALDACFDAVWRHWLAHARIDFEGMNLLHMALIRHHSALARLTWMAYAARRFVEALRPRRVYVFDEPPAHGLDQPVAHRRLPLLSGMMAAAAERCGAEIEMIAGAGKVFDDHVARIESAAGASLEAAAFPTRPYVLFQANRTDLLRQLPLVGALRSETGLDCVQLYREADEAVVRQARAAGHAVLHEAQVAPSIKFPDISASARAARAAFDRAARQAGEDVRMVCGNPRVASHFDFLFGEYARKLAAHVRRWRRLFAKARPAALICNYHAPILDVAADAGIPCLVLTHALMMIGQPQWYATLPRGVRIGALSGLHRDRLIDAGVTPRRIRVTGDPWVDSVRSGRDERSSGEESRSLRKRLGIAPPRRMVLICTGSYGMPSKTTILPEIDFEQGVRDMRGLAELARRRPDLAFVIKCHPRFDYPSFYEHLAATGPPDARLILAAEMPLPDLVNAADAVCVWNTITSALIEAALHPRPVCVFDGAMVWYDAHRWGTDAWPHFKAIESLVAEIDRIAADAEWRNRRIAQSQAALARFLDRPHDSYARRCIEALRDSLPAAHATA